MSSRGSHHPRPRNSVPRHARGTPPRVRRGGYGAALRRGDVLAYPTESFFAFGADSTNAQAVKKVFALKGRGNKPIALIAGSMKQVERFFFMTDAERRIARHYWPGALTLLLAPKAPTPSGSPSGRGRGIAARALGARRIGVRVPGHALARRLALAAGVPLTATSANSSGRPPTKSPGVIRRRFPAIMVVRGRCGRSTRPSTVVEVRKSVVRLIRSGAVTII